MAVVGAFGTKENAYVRQVLGYWEMVASLIVHGTLNAALAQDTLGEMYFVYAKVQPFVKQMREKMSRARVPAEPGEGRGGYAGRPRALKRMQARMAEFAKMRAAAAAKQEVLGQRWTYWTRGCGFSRASCFASGMVEGAFRDCIATRTESGVGQTSRSGANPAAQR